MEKYTRNVSICTFLAIFLSLHFEITILSVHVSLQNCFSQGLSTLLLSFNLNSKSEYTGNLRSTKHTQFQFFNSKISTDSLAFKKLFLASFFTFHLIKNFCWACIDPHVLHRLVVSRSLDNKFRFSPKLPKTVV